LDPSENFYYTDCSSNPQIGNSSYIYKITDPEGGSPTQSLYATLLGIYEIRGITFDPSGYLYVCDYNGGRIIRIDPTGTVEPSLLSQGLDQHYNPSQLNPMVIYGLHIIIMILVYTPPQVFPSMILILQKLLIV
jgi:DNA-binding beta-propeller fold protein YncE